MALNALSSFPALLKTFFKIGFMIHASFSVRPLLSANLYNSAPKAHEPGKPKYKLNRAACRIHNGPGHQCPSA
jgi:hypothetical protein